MANAAMIEGLECYLVGGAVRDQLLNLPIGERDWVVVGATPDDLLKRGFRQVGRDFPVFLHPATGEEYALARTERKHGHGHTGFDVYCDPGVTLQEDLLRRDLTVNAMAKSATGDLIDPYGGRSDLSARRLRHVSAAFIEDPLRVLRVARFAARFSALGFEVADETLALMGEISRQGELNYLSPERVWVELEKALATQAPGAFLETLRHCGALAALMPELDALWGVPQSARYHPEIDTGVHTLMTLEQAVHLSNSTAVRFAVLVHDLGKAATPADELPRHIGHEQRGLPLVRALCERLRVPNYPRDLALVVCEQHLNCHRATELRGTTVLKLLRKTGALRQPERFDDFLLACEADARGRLGSESEDYPQADYLRGALALVQGISAADFDGQGVSGKALGDAIAAEQVRQLEAYRPQRESPRREQ
ncbi:MAG: multifunctional CCA addition/repair protein [Pseudomonadota bacterium]